MLADAAPAELGTLIVTLVSLDVAADVTSDKAAVSLDVVIGGLKPTLLESVPLDPAPEDPSKMKVPRAPTVRPVSAGITFRSVGACSCDVRIAWPGSEGDEFDP